MTVFYLDVKPSVWGRDYRTNLLDSMFLAQRCLRWKGNARLIRFCGQTVEDDIRPKISLFMPFILCMFKIFIFLFGCIGSSLHHERSLLSCTVWDPVPWPRIKPGPLHWEHGVLVTAPPVKSLLVLFNHLFYQELLLKH